MSTDEVRELVDLLFGGGGDELIMKMSPTQSDVASKGGMSDKTKRKFTAGLSAVGATAGAAGLALASKETHKIAAPVYRAARAGAKPAGRMRALGRGLKASAKAKPLATGLVPLEVAGLGGELAATKILHGDTKKKTVSKADDPLNMLNNSSIPKTKGQLTRAVLTNPKVKKKGIEYTKKGAGQLKKLPDKIITTNDTVEKHYDEIDVVWDAEISKADVDKQQIFGWASVVEVNGEPIVDLQGDRISIDEMEKAGYEYVMKSRKGGDMHLRNDWSPIQKSEMIESFIVTPEKRDAMGLPDSVPSGWWVGFKVQDPQVWAKVKSGERTGFSIHGHGRRS
jgi:hypothetical protein